LQIIQNLKGELNEYKAKNNQSQFNNFKNYDEQVHNSHKSNIQNKFVFNS